jgi:DNA polymerase I
MDLLIDGDIVAYKCAFISDSKTEQEALTLTDDFLGNAVDYYLTFLSRAKYGNSQIFLTGKESFRKEVDPTYKENRKDKAKPKHLEAIRQHLIDKHGAKVSKNGYEADDSLGYLQTKAAEQSTVIFSIDKDLLQVPGYHFNFDNNTLTYVLPYQGLKQFYLQMLIGDPVDNVKGVDGIGKVGADKLLKGLLTEEQMFQIVQEQYQDDERMLKNSRLLWIKRADKNNPVEERLNG